MSERDAGIRLMLRRSAEAHGIEPDVLLHEVFLECCRHDPSGSTDRLLRWLMGELDAESLSRVEINALLVEAHRARKRLCAARSERAKQPPVLEAIDETKWPLDFDLATVVRMRRMRHAYLLGLSGVELDDSSRNGPGGPTPPVAPMALLAAILPQGRRPVNGGPRPPAPGLVPS